jgi:predicted acylesterase/phospholipase RssA/CRP-like cAMP-binding protein
VRAGLSASGSYATVEARAAELRDVLVTSSLFGDAAWADDVLADVVAELTTVLVRSGEVIVVEGEPSDDLLLVVSGRLRVVRAAAAGEETVLAHIGRGETVGELGLITRDPRSATVYAIRDSVLARLTREGYDRLCRRHPQAMMERFAGGMLRRLLQEARGESAHSRGFRGAIALFAGEPGVPLEPFAGELVRQLVRRGDTLEVTPDTCDRVLERVGACAATLHAEDEAKLARWLGAREQEHRFLLYRAEGAASEWGARCLRQADHVLVLVRARAAPATCDYHPAPGADLVRRRTSLVLLHDDGVVRRGAAAAWAEQVGADDVHHVRGGATDDVARLARLLAGDGTALVVGGGGARAFAAAGVARAVVEAGMPLDTVGGVSAGALVAALLAMGLSYDELVERCAGAAKRIDYTVPVYALTTGRNWSATLETLLADTSIEDLPVPYFCTSVNLSAAELLVHDRGSLLHAVRASTAIPGILPPVWHEGDLLVDGGLMNNLPVDLARERPGVARVLAVDVTPPRQRTPREPFGYHVSGWRALAGRIARRRTSLPTARDLLMQSMLVSDARIRRANGRLADWIFQPALGGYSLMDWNDFAAIADAGYRYASETLRDAAAREAVLGSGPGGAA